MKQSKTKTTLIRKLHALLSKLPDPEGAKEEIKDAYCVVSTTDLSDEQLRCICTGLSLSSDPAKTEMDKWRKRLIASIGAWLNALNRDSNINIIKGIACRAAGAQAFNKIPKERLRSLYNAFNNKSKDLQSVAELTAIELDYLSISN